VNVEEAPSRDVVTAGAFEPVISAAEAAQLIGGIHKKTLQKMAREGRIPAYRIGKAWFFRASELNNWLAVQSQRQPVRVN
jgi:excisionase family DNA binding protein